MQRGRPQIIVRRRICRAENDSKNMKTGKQFGCNFEDKTLTGFPMQLEKIQKRCYDLSFKLMKRMATPNEAITILNCLQKTDAFCCVNTMKEENWRESWAEI